MKTNKIRVNGINYDIEDSKAQEILKILTGTGEESIDGRINKSLSKINEDSLSVLETVQKNKEAIETEINRSTEKDLLLQETIENKEFNIITGDTVVGQAREVYSRNGKEVTDSFLARTTAGSGTIGDDMAEIKKIGGNIVKNLVDGTIESGWNYGSAEYMNIKNGILTLQNGAPKILQISRSVDTIKGHKYYLSVFCKSHTGIQASFENLSGSTTSTNNVDTWTNLSIVSTHTKEEYKTLIVRAYNATNLYATKPLFIDLTENFGAGKEPTKEECDRLFGTMDALPQGLTIANPTSFKSVGYNQFNPENVLKGKTIDESGAIIDNVGTDIAVIPCLPCKVGTGENNGYCIHGDFKLGAESVYLTPLNPLEVEGELYMHELTPDADKGTYVPLIKGYMLVVVPRTDNLCVHFLWSEDRDKHDYEPYHESVVELPTIPEMPEYGLAGIQSSGTLVCDEIDFERGVYIKRIGCVDLGTLGWRRSSVSGVFYAIVNDILSSNAPNGTLGTGGYCIKYTTIIANYSSFANIPDKNIVYGSTIINSATPSIVIQDLQYDNINDFTTSVKGVVAYYQLATPEEYPIPSLENYVSSDYGTEEFVGSKIPLNASTLYYMRSLVGETRNFFDKLYESTGKSNSNSLVDYITNNLADKIPLSTQDNDGLMGKEDKTALDVLVENNITTEETNQVVEGIEENLVSNALRKTPQLLTDSEKQQARLNIEAQKELILTIKDNGNIVISNIQGQTKEFMPATPSGDPLHYAYLEAGAEYNDTNNHIVKVTPWKSSIDSNEYKAQWNLDVLSGEVHTITYGGKTYEYVDDNGTWKIIARVGDKMIWDDSFVIHRIGYYYLNGLGDITLDQMRRIYDVGRTVSPNSDALFAQKGGSLFVTNIPATLHGGEGSAVKFYYICNGTGGIRVFKNTKTSTKTWVNTIHCAWTGCTKLRYVVPIVDVNGASTNAHTSGAFTNCTSLVLCRLCKLKTPISFSHSPLISKYSILNTIMEAIPTTAITITLHHDAYARLTSDEDIINALTEKNASLAATNGKISLVCATHSEETIS